MSNLIRHRLTGVAAIALVLTLGVQPVIADTERGHSGTVGFHRLVDSSTSPGVMCLYAPLDGMDPNYSYLGELIHLYVWPPRVRAISGTQRVGWRFIVQRRAEWDELSSYWSPWSVRYRSPIQRKVTNTTENANFSQGNVAVSIPANYERRYEYRVLIRMYWFRSDGTVQGAATHRVDWYHRIYSYWPGGGAPTENLRSPCENTADL